MSMPLTLPPPFGHAETAGAMIVAVAEIDADTDSALPVLESASPAVSVR